MRKRCESQTVPRPVLFFLERFLRLGRWAQACIALVAVAAVPFLAWGLFWVIGATLLGLTMGFGGDPSWWSLASMGRLLGDVAAQAYPPTPVEAAFNALVVGTGVVGLLTVPFALMVLVVDVVRAWRGP